MKNKHAKIAPVQYTGRSINASTTTEVSAERSQSFFELAKSRLLDVNHWKEHAEGLSAQFSLVDQSGRLVHRHVQKGDYIKIDIPGPGSKSGNGFDWALVEEIESHSGYDSESVGFRVRPTSNPQSNDDAVAHFYSRDATSSFMVERNANKITATVLDRNIKPNTDANGVADKVRDAIIGIAGALTFSKIQWENLTDGLVKD